MRGGALLICVSGAFLTRASHSCRKRVTCVEKLTGCFKAFKKNERASSFCFILFRHWLQQPGTCWPESRNRVRCRGAAGISGVAGIAQSRFVCATLRKKGRRALRCQTIRHKENNPFLDLSLSLSMPPLFHSSFSRQRCLRKSASLLLSSCNAIALKRIMDELIVSFEFLVKRIVSTE